MPKKGPVKVGIIGSQFQAHCHVEAFKAVPDAAQVVAVALPTPGNAGKHVVCEKPLCRMLEKQENIKAVLVITPDHSHTLVSIAAMKMGNVALHMPRKLFWDGPSLKVGNPSDAKKYIHCQYRKGWTL